MLGGLANLNLWEGILKIKQIIKQQLEQTKKPNCITRQYIPKGWVCVNAETFMEELAVRLKQEGVLRTGVWGKTMDGMQSWRRF